MNKMFGTMAKALDPWFAGCQTQKTFFGPAETTDRPW